jgi:hypothetical protein
MSDAPYVKLMRSMRAALQSYDEAAGAEDAHPIACPCGYCEFVRATRDLVEDYDFPPIGLPLDEEVPR